MNLVASLIVRDELGRYLEPCVRVLQTFCDEIRVLDDGSTDGTREWLELAERVEVAPNPGREMFAHEGRARQRLLDWTLKAEPTHILAIDADEIVTDGPAVRAAVEAGGGPGVWLLAMEEVWKATGDGLWVRHDGGWRPHDVPAVYHVPHRPDRWLRIKDRQLACGREPEAIRRLWARAVPTGASILHLGWACESDRAARYARYVEADGGRFHASTHLRSIMWPDRQVRLKRRPWPPALEPWREALVARAAKVAEAA